METLKGGCGAGCWYCSIRQLEGRKSSVWAARPGFFFFFYGRGGGPGDKRLPCYLCIKGHIGLAEEAKATTICVFHTLWCSYLDNRQPGWVNTHMHAGITSLTHICARRLRDERCIVRRSWKAPRSVFLLVMCVSEYHCYCNAHNLCPRYSSEWIALIYQRFDLCFVLVLCRMLGDFSFTWQTVKDDISLCSSDVSQRSTQLSCTMHSSSWQTHVTVVYEFKL